MPPDSDATPESRSASRLLIVIALAVTGLAAVFGVTTARSRTQFTEYKEQTLEHPERPLPWVVGDVTPVECVEFSTQWALECPAIESWCFNEAPRIVLDCMKSEDRKAYCESVAGDVETTHFGAKVCQGLRESLPRHLKRPHKKACGSAFRAVAEFCREQLRPAPETASSP